MIIYSHFSEIYYFNHRTDGAVYGVPPSVSPVGKLCNRAFPLGIPARTDHSDMVPDYLGND